MQAANPIDQIMSTIRTAQNPREAALNIIRRNSQVLQQAMDYVKRCGGDYKAAAEQLIRDRMTTRR